MRINPFRPRQPTSGHGGRHRAAGADDRAGPDTNQSTDAEAVEQIRAACVDGVTRARQISEASPLWTRWWSPTRTWVRGVWAYWVTYWPALAYLVIAARALLGWPGWRWIARQCGHARHATADAARAVAGWVRAARDATVTAGRWVWRWLYPVLRWSWRLAVRCGQWMWMRVEPYVRDACGWLVHTAPRQVARWCGRMLARFLRWVFPALARALASAAVGLWWLLRRLIRYVLAYPEYLPLVRELEEEGHRARRVKAARDAWRKTFYRRTAGLAVVGLVVGVTVAQVISRYGPRATLLLVVVAVAVLAGVGRAVRPRPERAADAPDERGEDEPYPIADAHTRAEAADCVARAVRAEGIDLRMAGDARREPWGWTVPVILRRGTPAAIVAKLGELETTLDLPMGGVLAAPDRTRRARVVVFGRVSRPRFSSVVWPRLASATSFGPT